MDQPTNQNENYPAWMNAWNARAAEIDDEIIEFFKDLPENTSEAWENVTQKLHAWWDKQTIDDKARAEFAEFKADAKAFKAKLDERVKHLIQEGRLKLAEKRKDGDEQA
jgi:hypothetical protein